MHRHFRDIGYHYYITRDGVVHNSHSVGICYEGGLDADGNPADTRTDAQKRALSVLAGRLKARFPKALIVGHRELNPEKACPCFDVAKDLAPGR